MVPFCKSEIKFKLLSPATEGLMGRTKEQRRRAEHAAHMRAMKKKKRTYESESDCGYEGGVNDSGDSDDEPEPPTDFEDSDGFVYPAGDDESELEPEVVELFGEELEHNLREQSAPLDSADVAGSPALTVAPSQCQ